MPDNNIEHGNPIKGSQPISIRDATVPVPQSRVPVGFRQQGRLIWTVTANGKTERAYASLKSDYQIDKQVISTEVGGDFGSLRDELRTNTPPDLRVEGDKHRSVKAGEPLTLLTFATDPDNLPARRAEGVVQPYRPTSSLAARSGPGLRLSWIVYRGKAATVTFSPDQMKLDGQV